MNNYDRIKNMTIEEMARNNVRVFYIIKTPKYITSDSNIFGMYDEAIQHEIEWLNSEIEG